MPPDSRRLRIAFYAPLKAPGHPVPSGDRLMARQLKACLEMAGHAVTVASDLRAYLGNAEDSAGWARLEDAAGAECSRIAEAWTQDGPPDLWFSYHPYYKAPDLLGPVLARRFDLPCVTCEASYSARRNIGIWAETQARMLAMVKHSALNLSITERDRVGLLAAAPDAVVERLSPFTDVTPFSAKSRPEPGHLLAVAMMRSGDKHESYRRLATALALLPAGLDWRLTVVGDGPLRAEVHALFAGFPADRISWPGQVSREEVARLMCCAAVYVWPGCGEAYGLAYLEAQAAGLPVVAGAVAGVPEVVADGTTGILAPEADPAALAAALRTLLTDESLRARMGQSARHRVRERHTMVGASHRLDKLLQALVAR